MYIVKNFEKLISISKMKISVIFYQNNPINSLKIIKEDNLSNDNDKKEGNLISTYNYFYMAPIFSLDLLFKQILTIVI